eukprot:GHVS01040207.1.p2 GENE.GHVS01040207.1~~GHVS01040207.1.p2  ORF type:complete len:273 (+),score=57.93 GHVS01040207.1:209-1027(+)
MAGNNDSSSGGGKAEEHQERVQLILANGSSRYDPASLSVLTQMVAEDITTGSYHLEVNLAILTLYSIYPQCFDFAVVRSILILSLGQIPYNDFTDCLALIPEHYQKDQRLLPLLKIEELLQECRFKQCWDELKDSSGPLGDLLGLPSFADSIRRFVCEIVVLTYHTIAAGDLTSLLNMTVGSSEFDRLLRCNGWVVEEGPRRVGIVRVGGAAIAKDGGGTTTAEGGGGSGKKTTTGSSGGGTIGSSKPLLHATTENMNPEMLRLCFSALKNV